MVDPRDNPPRLSLLDLRLQSLDPSTQGLGFALFDHAFERQFQPDHPYYDQVDPILNQADPARNFVGADSRRFYLHLQDARALPTGRLADGRGYLLARWYTRAPDGSLLDDNGGEDTITLLAEASGEYRSRALLLVTSDEDRDLAPHAGVEGKYPTGSVRRGYGQSDHRLRLADLFGETVFEYPASPRPNAPSVRLTARPFLQNQIRRLPLQLFVLSTHGITRPVTFPDQLFGVSLERARRIYATLGIWVETAPHRVAESMLLRADPRICRITGGAGGYDFYYVIDTAALLGRTRLDQGLTPEHFSAFCRQFPATDRTVRALIVEAFREGQFGIAYPESDFAGRVEAGACGCQAEKYPNRAILAHEVGHILTNKGLAFGTIADQTNGFTQFGGHYSRPAEPADNRFIHFYNLMGGSRYRLYDVDVPERSTETGEVRVFNQFRDIRNSPYLR